MTLQVVNFQRCVPSVSGISEIAAFSPSPLADDLSASSTICHLLSLLQSITPPACLLNASPCVPAVVLYYCISKYCKIQFSSVAQSCPTLCDPMNCSTPGLPVHHQLLEFTQTHVHWVGDAIQPSHPPSSPSPPALNLSQHQGLFKRVSSSHQVAKVLEFQLQHQSFQWTPRTDLL